MRQCKQCGGSIPGYNHFLVKYCSNVCRAKNHRNLAKTWARSNKEKTHRRKHVKKLDPGREFERFGVTVIFAPDVPGGYSEGSQFSNAGAYGTLLLGYFDPGMVLEINSSAVSDSYHLVGGTYRVKPKSEWLLSLRGYNPKDSLEKIA